MRAHLACGRLAGIVEQLDDGVRTTDVALVVGRGACFERFSTDVPDTLEEKQSSEPGRRDGVRLVPPRIAFDGEQGVDGSRGLRDRRNRRRGFRAARLQVARRPETSGWADRVSRR